MSDERVLDPPVAPVEALEPVLAPAAPVRRRPSRRLRSWAALLLVVAVVSVLVRTFAIQTFYVPSGSMEPTLWPGQAIVVDKLAAEFGAIHTGDVIVFHANPAVARDCADPLPDLVKRVVGLPGQSVYSVGSTLYVDYRPLDQAWAHYEPLTPAIGSPAHPVVVPAGEYFVLGDNQPDSCDSRYWGFVPHGAIIGKVFLRIWPLSKLGGV